MVKVKFLLLFLCFSHYLEAAEQTLLGFWIARDSIIEIKYCGDFICGEIVHIIVEEGEDPKKILDENNTDDDLKSRALIGINIITGFKKELVLKSELKGGKIYDPRFGKTYKAKLKLLDNGNIKVEGCILFICDGEEWQPLLVTTNEDGTRDAILKNDPNEVQ